MNHDVLFDLTSSGHKRLTCRSHDDREPAIVQQPYMRDVDWLSAVRVFLREHHGTVTESGR